MDSLIQQLQDLKLDQLMNHGKFPFISADSLDERKNELLCKLNGAISKLRSLESQKLRLLCVLAFDNIDLLLEFSDHKETKLLEKISRQYFLYGDEFLLNRIPVHEMLKSWYIQLKELNHQYSKQISSNEDCYSLGDKAAFDIMYHPFCTSCKETIGLSQSSCSKIFNEDRKMLATTSFSTCRQGFCCRITLQASCRLCSLQRNTSDLDEVLLTTDPSFGISQKSFLSDGNGSTTAKDFITENMWPAIDRICSTVSFSKSKENSVSKEKKTEKGKQIQ